LHQADSGEYVAELRFRMNGVDQWSRGHPKIDPEKLEQVPVLDEDLVPPDPGDAPAGAAPPALPYGKVLFKQLFAEPALQTAFDNALVAAAAKDQPLRVRLFVGPTAPQLHRLRWELLHDPRQIKPVWKGDRVYFCRYLSSSEWQPVELRPKESQRALIVVASPKDLKQYKMEPIDVPIALIRARASLPDIPADDVTGPDTLNKMHEKLQGEYDILYLICHGGLGTTKEPRLWLEDEKGQSLLTAPNVLVTLLANLWHQPQLVVLAACYGAGVGEDAPSLNDGGVLAAIGPKLAEAGLPAVLAMQGRVTVKTAERFLDQFFRTLTQHGQIDRAATVARGAVQDRPDHWMPVLFSRISHGRIWSAQGAGELFGSWDGLVDALKSRDCVPVLGWGLLEGLVGGPREVARRWARDAGFAMSPYRREDLPHVAQYIAVTQGRLYPRRNLASRFQEEVKRRVPEALPAQDSVDDLLAAARARRRAAGRFDPFEVLAKLPFRLYLTTTPDDQLERALRAADRQPDVSVCPWHDRDKVAWPVTEVLQKDPYYVPTNDKRPLVYQLFGRLGLSNSLVLTEDDYFDFLIEVNRDVDRRLPRGIRTKLGTSMLLFLGFRMDEWDFRVLFRNILAQGDRWSLSEDFRHVAVQIDPEDGRIIDPEKARKYLHDYFQRADIDLYWGSVEDFLRELTDRWSRV
jgi:hypothetical protein